MWCFELQGLRKLAETLAGDTIVAGWPSLIASNVAATTFIATVARLAMRSPQPLAFGGLI